MRKCSRHRESSFRSHYPFIRRHQREIREELESGCTTNTVAKIIELWCWHWGGCPSHVVGDGWTEHWSRNKTSWQVLEVHVQSEVPKLAKRNPGPQEHSGLQGCTRNTCMCVSQFCPVFSQSSMGMKLGPLAILLGTPQKDVLRWKQALDSCSRRADCSSACSWKDAPNCRAGWPGAGMGAHAPSESLA